MGETTEPSIILRQGRIKLCLSEEKTMKTDYLLRLAEPFLYLPPGESRHLHLTVKNKDKTSGSKLRAGSFISFPPPILFVL